MPEPVPLLSLCAEVVSAKAAAVSVACGIVPAPFHTDVARLISGRWEADASVVTCVSVRSASVNDSVPEVASVVSPVAPV